MPKTLIENCFFKTALFRASTIYRASNKKYTDIETTQQAVFAELETQILNFVNVFIYDWYSQIIVKATFFCKQTGATSRWKKYILFGACRICINTKLK